MQSVGTAVSDHAIAHSPCIRTQRLVEYSADAENAFLDRLKIVASIANVTELNVGRFIESYNGKPFLTRPQHRFFRVRGRDCLSLRAAPLTAVVQGDGYFEIVIDVHRFCYLARKGLATLRDKHFVDRMVVDIAYVVEARDEEEMPERVVAAHKFSSLQTDRAVPLEVEDSGSEDGE